MVVLDVAIVNVALPTIKNDLHFSESGLRAWSKSRSPVPVGRPGPLNLTWPAVPQVEMCSWRLRSARDAEKRSGGCFPTGAAALSDARSRSRSRMSAALDSSAGRPFDVRKTGTMAPRSCRRRAVACPAEWVGTGRQVIQTDGFR
jgi:hypothetical protein